MKKVGIDMTETKEERRIITLHQAYKILEECAAIETEDGYLFTPSLSPIEESDENEFAHFRWKDNDGLQYAVTFAEGENQQVLVHGHIMEMIDTDGEIFIFYVLAPMNVTDYL